MTNFLQSLLIVSAAIASGSIAQAKQPAAAVAAEKSAQAPWLVPADFNVPTRVEAKDFKLVPLGPEVVQLDFDAYMSSIEHLQKTFSRSMRWPRTDITHADAMRDMEDEQARFKSRKSFAFAVLTPDGSRERGSVYVSPSPVEGYDAVVRMWVTKADYDTGFDAELYKWVTGWIQKDWPFRKVAYPGRSIDWTSWDPMVAARTPGKAGGAN
ncbi:MAG: twin-arginine translocation pathway signal protein [Sphingobium sp.]|nr:twin-arginine translocation pathway signal protein [Sphingobium sp.]